MVRLTKLDYVDDLMAVAGREDLFDWSLYGQRLTRMSKGFLMLSSSSVNFEPINRLSDIFFDEVNKKVCVVRGGGAMGVTARGPSPREVVSFRVSDKGTIFSIKLSLDLKIVAIQRTATATAVIFINIVNGAAETVEYAQTCKGKATRIIGVEWISSNEIIFITDHGLELYQVVSDKRMVRALKSVKASIMWFVYSPETQILVASSGSSGNVLQPYCVTPGNIVRLAKFEVEIGSVSSATKWALLDRDVCVASVYGLIYIMILRHVSAAPGSTSSLLNYESGSEVLLYFLQRDSATIPPKKHHILQLGTTGKFAVHVIDDLIVVHQQMSKTSLIFDIRARGISDGSVTMHRPLTALVSIVVPTAGNISTDPDSSYDPQVELYANSWVLFLPDLIIDAKVGCMWRLQLNLSAICDLLDDRCLLVEFLLRRAGSKGLLLDVIRENVLKQRVSLIEAGTIWDLLCNVFKIHAEAVAKGILVDSGVKVVVDQSDIHNLAFIPLVEDANIDFDWLSKVMLEYLSSLQQRDIFVQPFLHELLVRSLVKSERYQKLHQLVEHGVISPSKPLAFLLLSLETQYPAALQMAMDMLSKSDAAADEIVEILLSKQHVVDALRYAQTCGVLDRLHPMKFVEAAWQSPDKHVRFTVFRYFEQRSLRMKGTPQFAKGEQFEQYAAEFRRLWASESEPIVMATLAHNGS